ncbi:aminotransferase class V-fold PLP-dependent enzyme [Planktothrix sp. FACHB-1355]|uniref:Aminotransferase class V-fold PLP-dependent enzyme n=1 Tax=Aerosakkonema funiforme FACHB-1375 TaxID=2949571 RepID=A0A926ZKC1_9CYAN|nr:MULTISPECIES: aminotransferase class V-fold PLP-dependent enzyme [Oscillatoriales]MBD2185619.1 aminotransferase class V-fold PLP-dependent enzyme [Aerosakkonema funiforme FACHB-1375]MBD3561256.1 aminotransferase class V-fold PLP-dependent enzyme [Planktothrix sp. FACHB-1355]
MKKTNFKPTPSEFEKFWMLDADITFLNHGSFGACPLPVLEAQQRLRQQMEREPLRFFVREYEALLDAARSELAEFIGADASELVFVPNATTGVNAVLRSLKFSKDDELLTTDQEYNACRNVLDFVAAETGARVVVAKVPFPIESPDRIIEAVMEKVRSQTRLVLLDHITSQTGLIFPIQSIVQKLTELGIDTLIDGAHAPGMLALNLHQIGATYYTGNCHKWLCAPKGAAFLYVRRDRQSQIRPMTISHGANSPRTDRSLFQLEFDWMGTDDPTAYLCVPAAIKFMGSLLEGGWPELMARNRALALAARQTLCKALGVSPPCPDETIAAMAVVPLPDAVPHTGKAPLIPLLQDALFKKFGIEVPVVPWPTAPKQLLRISAQIYNTPAQYEYLALAIGQLIEG